MLPRTIALLTITIMRHMIALKYHAGNNNLGLDGLQVLATHLRSNRTLRTISIGGKLAQIAHDRRPTFGDSATSFHSARSSHIPLRSQSHRESGGATDTCQGTLLQPHAADIHPGRSGAG